MSSDEWFGELSQTLQCDSTWSPTIVLPIVLIPSMEKATTDIVPYFNHQPLQKMLLPIHSILPFILMDTM